MRRLLTVVIVSLMLLATDAYGQLTPEKRTRAEALIKQLGDERAAVRQEASRKLEEIGWLALGALEKAMKSDDPEVRIRATEIYQKLINPTPEKLRQTREVVQKALSQGDCDRMIASAHLLAVAKTAEASDLLWLGHACQLSGRWKEAVAAYLDVLRRLEAERKPVDGRVSLALWIARMQRVELEDPKAAAKTLTKILRLLDVGRATPDYWPGVLRELAMAREEAGDLGGTLRAWDMRHLVCMKDPRKYRNDEWVDMISVERLLRCADAAKGLPEVAWLIRLSPEKPQVTLVPDDAETRRRSYRQPGISRDGPTWRYAFASPPGKEFATIEFACDIEQLAPSPGRHFTCFHEAPGDPPSVTVLGKITWPRRKRPGREVLRASFEVAPGVRIVHIVSGSYKRFFTMHRIDVKGTFREAQGATGPPPPKFAQRVKTEFLPAGGKVSCGDKTLFLRGVTRRFPPGRYRLRYEVPGREKVFETDVVIEAGKRYSFFANLDSPFRWTTFPVENATGGMVHHGGVAPLSGGGMVAVWIDRGGRLFISRTKDGTEWTKPERAPFGSVFPDRCPSLLAAKDGTVWLAWASPRLDLVTPEKPAYRLWLTSTRDGVKWSPLRSPTVKIFPYWHSTGIRMVEDREGRAWVFAGRWAGSAKSFADIRELRPMQLSDELPLNMSVALDGDGHFHMAYWNVGLGIRHIVSIDGIRWSAPRTLVEGTSSFTSSHPRLLIENDRALLIYTNEGAWLIPIRFDGKPLKPRTGLKIIGTRMHGSPLTRTKDGEVLLLAGAANRWLLRAKLSDLLKLCDEKKQ